MTRRWWASGLVAGAIALVWACGDDGAGGADSGSAARDGGARDGGARVDGASPIDAATSALDAGPGVLDARPDDFDAGPIAVLVFTRTEGYRHASIADGVAAVRELGAARGYTIEHTEEVDVFDTAGLASYQVVMFLSTTGDVLDAPQEAALEAWVRAGGGFVGVHSAADTEYDWPFYAELVGALFLSHPAIQDATMIVEDRSHPSTAHLGETWMRRDEWYDYRTSPRGSVSVLLSLDHESYTGSVMAGSDHPIAWHHAIDAGRAFYTGGGHTSESWAEPDFRAHVAGAIEWAAGR